MCDCHSILEGCVMFPGVKFNMLRLFNLLIYEPCFLYFRMLFLNSFPFDLSLNFLQLMNSVTAGKLP